MNTSRLVSTVSLLISLLACEVSPPTRLITFDVADRYRDCTGVGPMHCLYVREKGASGWQYFYDPISGFTYEEGYTYTIRVKREQVPNPPADGSTYRYTLVKVLTKEKA